MPAYRRGQRVRFLEDFDKDGFGRPHGAFPVGRNSEQKWARKGDAGVVSAWSKGGWIKVRLDRHDAIVTVRVGKGLMSERDFVEKSAPPPLWSQEARDEVPKMWDALLADDGGDSIMGKMHNLHLQIAEAVEADEPVDEDDVEAVALELESAARMLRKLSISTFPTQTPAKGVEVC